MWTEFFDLKYWLMKSEPDVYSIHDLEKDGSTCWEGVRNYQARNNMVEMRVGDGVQVLASLPAGEPVAVRQDNMLASSFHPELTNDTRFHRYFLDMLSPGSVHPR